MPSQPVISNYLVLRALSVVSRGVETGANKYRECETDIKIISGHIQGGSNMTGTNFDLFTHNQSRSYLNHPVFV